MSLVVNGKEASVSNINIPTSQSAPSERSDVFGSMEDLIPTEFKKIFEEKESGGSVEKKDTEAPLVSKPVQQASPTAPVIPSTNNVEEDEDDEPDDEEDGGNVVSSSAASKKVDTSLEGISRLLSGEADDEDESPKGKGDPLPPWKEEEKYKALSNKLKTMGFKDEELDEVIETVTESRVLESGNYVKSLTEERDSLQTKIKHNETEIARLRALEKVAHFENSPEVRDTYHVPMQADYKAIQKVIDLAGGNVPALNVLKASNRVEVMDLVKSLALDGDELTQIMNHWKSYKDLELRYNTARSTAHTQLAKHLSTEIPKDIGRQIFNNTFIEAAKDESLSYMNEAILAGAGKQPEVEELVGHARQMFDNWLSILSNPVEHTKDHEFLSSLAKFSLQNADAQYKRKKYYDLEKTLAEKEEALQKIVSAYRELKRSAKGLSGNPGKLSMGRNGANGSSSSSKNEQQKLLQNLEALATNRLDLDKFLKG